MAPPSQAISTYIAAKDGNRPWLMHRAFASDATLEMEVKTDAVAFPSSATGLPEITEILVRRFCREFQNVHTFCLCSPPEPFEIAFACNWLVGMSRVDTGDLRVGCGRYDWSFRGHDPHLVERLKITIEVMEVLAPSKLMTVMNWLAALPYPWCPAEKATEEIPDLASYMRGASSVANVAGTERP